VILKTYFGQLACGTIISAGHLALLEGVRGSNSRRGGCKEKSSRSDEVDHVAGEVYWCSNGFESTRR
jgi:hypothetical protein